MPAFRIFNSFPVYLGSTGRPAASGELRFYKSGTKTPKSVYGDPGLTIDNGSVIDLKPDSRRFRSTAAPSSSSCTTA